MQSAQSYGVDAQIIGSVENAGEKELIIETKDGELKF